MDVCTSRAPARTADDCVHMEDVNCPLCGGNHSRPLIETRDPLAGSATRLMFTVVRCDECGLCYTNPRPTPDSIGRFYPDEYSCHQLDSKQSRSCQRRYPMNKLLPPSEGGRLLDFGCGAGGFLQYARAQGWWPTGMDVSPRMVGHIRTNLRLPALTGSLPHAELAPASFEAVTLWQSLEHVHQPLNVLREVHRLLVPGGRVVIAVPNIDSLAFEWFGAHWHGLELPRHLTHFSPATLRTILERAGFGLTQLHMVRHNGWLRHSARLARRTPVRASPLCRLMRVRWWSSWFGSYSHFQGRANCIVASAVKA